MSIIQVVAIDKNGGIGKDNTLPWGRNPEDMKLFKDITMGNIDDEQNTLFMGRNTYDSLPCKVSKYHPLGQRALSGRTNVVISHSMAIDKKYKLNKHQGCYITKNLDIITEDCPLLKGDRFIIGGESLYVQTLDITDKIYMTRFNEEYECDTFYPLDKLSDFYLDETVPYNSFVLEIYIRK